MQTKFKIVETEEYYLALSDERIKVGYYYHLEDDKILKCNEHTESIMDAIEDKSHLRKIMAYLPKNNAPELDLPLLPEIIIEPRGFDEFQYTEQDMINLARDISREWFNFKLAGILDSVEWTKKYLQSLNQPKTPTHFEAKFKGPKMIYSEKYGTMMHNPSCYKLKTELINDKETLVGKYLFK